MRQRPFLAAAVLAFCALPGAAQASTAGIQGTTLTITAATGETNRFGVTLAGSTVRVTDDGRIRAAAGCTQVGAAVSCPITGLTGLVADLGGGNDRIVLEPRFALRSRLRGGTGNDILVGGRGPDELDGGTGRDVVSYERHTDAVRVTLNGGVPGGDGAPGEGDDVLAVEQVIGTAGYDELIGSDAAERLEGRGGNDRLDGGGGNDLLAGGTGDDPMDGGAGDDVFLASRTRDGADVLRGGPGTDRADYSRRTVGVVADPDGRPDDGERPGGRLGFAALVPAIAVTTSLEGDSLLPDVEQVRGGQGDDVLAAGENGGRVEGLAGTDVVGGGPAGDVLDGGAGFDRLLARDRRSDEIQCGSQTDRVYADASDRPRGDCESVLRGFAPILAPRARRLDRGALQTIVTCPAQASVRCVGAVRIVTVRRVRTRAGARRTRTLGAARFNAPAGMPAVVRIALNAAGRRTLDRLGGATRVRVVARGRDEAGPSRPTAVRLILRR